MRWFKKNKPDGRTIRNFHDEFEEANPGKHAVWRGNETNAFIKWKEVNG